MEDNKLEETKEENQFEEKEENKIEKKKEDKKKFNIVLIIAAGSIMVLLIGFLCFQYFIVGSSNVGKQENGENLVSLVQDSKNLKLTYSISDYIYTGTCKKSSINTKYSIQMTDGKAIVTNHKTMENFQIDKFMNAKVLTQFSYTGECDEKIYIVLTRDGRIYYTNDDITRISDVKDIENKFYLLKTDLRFNAVSVAKVNGKIQLYGISATDNIYKIDLR